MPDSLPNSPIFTVHVHAPRRTLLNSGTAHPVRRNSHRTNDQRGCRAYLPVPTATRRSCRLRRVPANQEREVRYESATTTRLRYAVSQPTGPSSVVQDRIAHTYTWPPTAHHHRAQTSRRRALARLIGLQQPLAASALIPGTQIDRSSEPEPQQGTSPARPVPLTGFRLIVALALAWPTQGPARHRPREAPPSSHETALTQHPVAPRKHKGTRPVPGNRSFERFNKMGDTGRLQIHDRSARVAATRGYKAT
ncbi:hypothetical protein BC628DRAFT_185546 [Trametes gibbosa]|nr:hypothetical protein BC628DRAFT_185546 [Trametes gibbosa]